MNRYNYNKIEELGILERMALLREQKKLIKAFHNIHQNDAILLLGQRVQVKAFLGLASDAEILSHLRQHCILLSDKVGEFPKTKEEKGHYARCSKIATLFQSCIDSGFVIPVENLIREDSDKMIYYRITDKGSDLLHFFGFIQIAFDKYSKIIVFLWGVLTVVLLKAITWIIAHWDFVKGLVDHSK